MDPQINPETGESVGQGRSPRLSLWMAFLVCSVVVLGSSVQVRNAADPVAPANTFIVVCAVVTSLLTAGIVACHFNDVATMIFVGTKVEGIVTIVLVAFWSAIVAANTQAGDGLSPIGEDSDAVQNGNMYYFSWAGFIFSIVLLVSFLRDAFGLDMVGQVRNQGARLQWWAALLAAGVIVLGSAAETLRTDCHDDIAGYDQSASYCRKTRWAIAAGFFNILLCAFVIWTKVFKHSAIEAATPFLIEMVVSIFLLVINVFAVGYITSADGPGGPIGNLYYFSWAIFLLAAVLVSECYTEYTQPAGSTDSEGGSANGNGAPQYSQNGRGELDVETLDDNL